MSNVIKSKKKVLCVVLIVVMVLVYRVPQKVSAATNFDAFMGFYQPDSIGLQEVAKGVISGQSWNAWFNANRGYHKKGSGSCIII